MGILLTAVHVVICFILIAVILLQAGRGQGLAGPSFTAGNVQSLFGTRAADFLTKATTVSAILFLFTCIGLDIMETQKSRSLFERRRPVASAQPIDAQQIQKVLEKIKAGDTVIPSLPEAKKNPPAAPAQAVAQPSTAVPATASQPPQPPTKKD